MDTTAAKLADLREKLRVAENPGCEKADAKRAAKGIPSPRERLRMLFDPGTFVEMGVDPSPLFDAVHQANMDKLWDGEPKYNPTNGKTLKPPGWVGPEERLKALIDAQIAQSTAKVEDIE